MQTLAIAVAQISIVLSMVAYYRSQRAGWWAAGVSGKEVFEFFYWQYSSIVIRLAALSFFAVSNIKTLVIIVGVHEFVMLAYQMCCAERLYYTCCQSALIVVIVSLVHVICYVGVGESVSNNFRMFHCIVMLLENSIMLLLWSIYNDAPYEVFLLAFSFIMDGLGIVITVGYGSSKDLDILPRTRRDQVVHDIKQTLEKLYPPT